MRDANNGAETPLSGRRGRSDRRPEDIARRKGEDAVVEAQYGGIPDLLRGMLIGIAASAAVVALAIWLVRLLLGMTRAAP